MIRIVHVSGYALTAKDREHVCWGDPERRLMGRIPMALWIARTMRADHIVWSTGATVDDMGVKEGRILFDRAMGGLSDLKRDFPHFFELFSSSGSDYRAWLGRTAIFELSSTNTRTSMEELERIVSRWYEEQVIVHLVSSANHVMRVLRDAAIAFGIGTRIRKRENVILMAAPAQTCYGDTTVEDTVVRDLGD